MRELRAKPPMAVRVKPAEDEPAPEQAPAPRLRSEMGELPDPDSFDLPPRKEDAPAPEAVKADEVSTAPKKEGKLGFFSRFKKK